jgi:flagellar hook-associated protein 1 FlgK
VDSYDIGISGLNAAQKAFEVIGNNISNAATDGYHRQRLELVPAYASQVDSVLIGGGVDAAKVTRLVDSLLEKEILHQQSSLGQISQEVDILRTVETAFGELSAGSSLNQAIDNFFNSLQDLSAHPSEVVWQNQALTAAETMTSQFRSLDEFIGNLDSQIMLEADHTIKEINNLVNSIAQLNNDIERQVIAGGQANNLRDERDQYLSKLSGLISVQTQDREYGAVDVSIGGIPILTGTSAIELEVGLKENVGMGITVAGEYNYYTDIQGGKLGGLLSLKNDIISGIQSDLNTLAAALIQQVNQYHIQGAGSKGSFTELTGSSIVSQNLADFDPPVTDGNIYIRVVNTGTGAITRTAVPVDVSEDSLSSLAAAISAITGLTASVSDLKLHIQTDPGYQFDFLPAVLPLPTDSDFSGAASPPTVSVSGLYTGAENQTLTFAVSGTGSVGNGTLQIIVTDGDGDTVTTLNVGSGYAAGDVLNAGNGIKVALGAGDLVGGNTFEVDVFADTDTSSVLAAAGINTFFSGKNASDIEVSSDLLDFPGRIATALGADLTDNTNALRLASLRDQAFTDLDSMTPGDYYRQLVTDLGLDLSTRQVRQDNIEAIVQNLSNQQSEVSGIDINDEAAQMLIFEQMFKAMAKYLSTIQSSLSTIMELL